MFAVKKEAKVNFDEAKKSRDSTLKPKATMHFCFNSKKSTLPATPAVWMVAPAPEEGSGEGEATPILSKESDSGESYEATQYDTTVSQGDVEIAVRVVQASETGTCKDQQGQAGPWSKRPIQDYRDEGHSLKTASPRSRKKENINVGGKEEVWTH